MSISNLFVLQITIFLLMAIGYFLTKRNILPFSMRQPMTDLVIDLVLPCNIIVSFMIEFSAEILRRCLVICIISLVVAITTHIVGKYLYPWASEDDLIVFRYATLVSNAGLLGSPIIEGLYGSIGLLYASVFLVPLRIIMWSSGLSLYKKVEGKSVIKKALTHPCVVAVFIGLILMLTQYTPPAPITKTLTVISNCNMALCMFIIGNILAEVSIPELFNRKTLYYCLIRLVIIPAITLFVLSLLPIDRTVTGVATVLTGMPAAATSAILAAKYKRSEHLAVCLVCLSTLLSMITIPVMCLIMTCIFPA